ncbi:MAG: hypothetical protein U1C51_05735, partial [Candidatus Izemoplasmatales bacterium]|nr:hypothetical protein [Candidatus Izemoplasmatales bacterium]
NEQNRFICTHLEENIEKDNSMISVLLSAWYLFQEYKKFDRTGKFDLECMPHGTKRDRMF